MVLVGCGGLTGDSMRGNGRMVLSMVRVNTRVVTVSGNKVVGSSVSV